MHIVGNFERAAVCAPRVELNSGQFFSTLVPGQGEENNAA